MNEISYMEAIRDVFAKGHISGCQKYSVDYWNLILFGNLLDELHSINKTLEEIKSQTLQGV